MHGGEAVATRPGGEAWVLQEEGSSLLGRSQLRTPRIPGFPAGVKVERPWLDRAPPGAGGQARQLPWEEPSRGCRVGAGGPLSRGRAARSVVRRPAGLGSLLFCLWSCVPGAVDESKVCLLTLLLKLMKKERLN